MMRSVSLCPVCEGVASKRCVCGKISYCGKSCQKSHWSLHRPDCLPYLLKVVEGRGRGLVATKKIKFGEELLREPPLLLIKNGGQANFLAWCDHVLALVKDLPESKSRDLQELADNTSLGQSPEFLYLKGVRGLSQECLKTLRIIRTNGINVDDEGSLTAVYSKFSRINHSCGPSAVRNIDPDTGEISVVAARQVEKGEEITIKYFDMESAGLRREERRLRLRRWGFLCCCDICSLIDEDLETNERLRERLNILLGKLKLCETDITNIPSLVEQEKLEIEILQILRSLQSQLSSSLPEHLMSLLHVSTLLTDHKQTTTSNLANIKCEAREMSAKLGPPFLDQFHYWENLTEKCSASIKKLKRKKRL